MRLSEKNKWSLFVLLIVLNIILRLQVAFRELGRDSFEMHIMTNSLNEFGYAKWFLDPLSVIGLYPASYASSMQFLLSGIHQCTNLQMNTVIFIYCLIIGVFSIFTSYIMTRQFSNSTIFALVSAIIFSTLQSTVSLTTWTIPTRGLFVVIAPILIFLILKVIPKYNNKYMLLISLFSLFLYATHHLFYFILPFFASASLVIITNTKLISEKIWYSLGFVSKAKTLSYISNPIFIIIGFSFMFFIPFFTGKFIENSRYSSFYISYARYLGISMIFAIGGLIYLIFKHERNVKEWFILVSTMLLTIFIYQETYMKNFLGIIAIFFITTGLLNAINVTFKKEHLSLILILFLVLSTSFSGYYQFIHQYGTEQNERYVSDSTYYTGNWIKEKIDEPCISNSLLATDKLFSLSENVHFLTGSTTVNQIYGFNVINSSQYERFPLTSDDFWLNGYKGPDVGESKWYALNMLWDSPSNYSIRYMVEDTKANGYIVWAHGGVKSALLQDAYTADNCIYSTEEYNIWDLNA